MRRVIPKIFLVGETRFVHADPHSPGGEGGSSIGQGLAYYLNEVPGANEWRTDAHSESEMLVEAAGRLCYRSWAPGLNPNVTKVREGNAKYIGNVLDSRHGSVLEHGTVSFIFHNVSRVFTHELVRHRAGCAISQESMRYVRLTDIPLWLPPATLAEIEELCRFVEGEAYHEQTVEEQIRDIVERIERLQLRVGSVIEAVEKDEPKAMPMSRKKKITSFMRRVAPDGVATGILWTANFRTLRHVLELRTEEAAEEEIRHIFDEVGRLVTQRYPAIFQDFERNGIGVWKPRASKV